MNMKIINKIKIIIKLPIWKIVAFQTEYKKILQMKEIKMIVINTLCKILLQCKAYMMKMESVILNPATLILHPLAKIFNHKKTSDTVKIV